MMSAADGRSATGSVREPSAAWRYLSMTLAERSFIDTNLLVYADSDDEPAKQHASVALIAALRRTQCGVLSTQVLNEYVNVGLRKLGLSHARLRAQLAFYRGFEVVSLTPEITEQALDLQQTRALSFYDALIVACASLAGCKVLYSEDLNASETIAGVRIINPFAKS